MEALRYLVFDVESVADGQLVSRLRYPGEDLGPQQAVQRYREELLAKYESDFIPYTYQVPICVAVAKVAADLRLMGIAVLDEPRFRPHVITENFWRGWQTYQEPTLVTFNGRTFDLPLMELAAFRFGVSIPNWFRRNCPTYEQPRNRYNTNAHFDLQELLTNFSSSRFTGGLHLAANLLGKPGKMDIQGYMVQDLYDQGRLQEINDYCRFDVLDTYFVFLRTKVLLGELPLEREHALVEQAKEWLEGQLKQTPAYQLYLDRWGEWNNPWSDGEESGE